MGSAERPHTPMGCGGVVLVFVTALGVAVWSLIAVAILWPSWQRFPQQLGWDHYLVVSALWSAGIGSFGIVRTVRRAPGSPAVRLSWCALGVLLAEAWPAQLVILAAVHAARAKGRRPRYRLGVLALGVLLSTAACLWGSTASSEHEFGSAPQGVSAATLRGSWHNVTGVGVLELDGNGSFSAHDVPAALDWAGPGVERVDAVGTWTVGSDGAYPTITLTITQGASSPGLGATAHLSVDAFGSSLVLCRWNDDPDAECDSGFHR